MNNNTTMGSKWHEVKRLIHATWTKFSKSDVESLENNLDGLVAKVVQVYGCAANRAERECHEFRRSLVPVLRPAVVKP